MIQLTPCEQICNLANRFQLLPISGYADVNYREGQNRWTLGGGPSVLTIRRICAEEVACGAEHVYLDIVARPLIVEELF